MTITGAPKHQLDFRYVARAPETGLGSKIEAEFSSFHPTPVKIRRRVDEMYISRHFKLSLGPNL